MQSRRIPTEAIELSNIPKMDPITVIFQDFGPGSGRIILESYGNAWSCYFGATGTPTIKDFFLSSDVDYLVSKLGSAQILKQTKREQKYLAQIIRAAQAGVIAGVTGLRQVS